MYPSKVAKLPRVAKTANPAIKLNKQLEIAMTLQECLLEHQDRSAEHLHMIYLTQIISYELFVKAGSLALQWLPYDVMTPTVSVQVHGCESSITPKRVQYCSIVN